MYILIIHKLLNTIITMSITNLMNEFNISKEEYIGSVISDRFIGHDSTNEMITRLEKYDIPTLQHIKKSLQKDSQDLYEKIMKRRHAYIDKVRRIHKIKKEQNMLNGASESIWIDFSGNGDDTENLVCGMNVISKGIDKINLIIEKKKEALELEENKRQRDYYIHMAVNLFVVATPLIVGAKMLL